MQSNLKRRPLHILARAVALLACEIICSELSSGIPEIIYPSASLFFLPASYQEDILYTSPLIFQAPLIVISQLLKHSFLVNIIAPFPNIYFIGKSSPAITFSHTLNFMLVGWLAIFLWLISLITSAVLAVSKKQETPLFVGFTFAICLLF